ncbi:MAG: SH3 domain-containing protein, partial [Anaerolineae bacterium]|nr:SH3 domain-containing protein [Anaerolineae bacterium]
MRNIAFMTLNEPGSPAEIARWHTHLNHSGLSTDRPKGVMDLAADKGIPLSVCHLAIGAWEKPALEELRPILQKCAQHDGLFAFGVHEYFTALPTSGMPETGSGGQPYFPVQPEDWPRENDITRYHVGRHQYLLDVCDQHGIPRPKLDVTETGADRLDEGGQGWVAQWLNSLKKTPGYLDIRFWRSCVTQWREWYGLRGWSTERTYYEMLTYLRDTVWSAPYQGQSRRVRLVTIFSWWNSGQIGTSFDWSAARVDNAIEFLHSLESEALLPDIPTLPEPQPIGTPGYAVIDSPAAINIRRAANINSDIVGQIRNGEKVRIEGTATDSEGVLWTKILRPGHGTTPTKTGYVSSRVARFEPYDAPLETDGVVVPRAEYD